MRHFLPLSYFSIRVQILCGFAPVLIVLVFLAISSYENFNSFSRKFETLSKTTNENLAFLEIQKDVVELQRNVLVYSYVGYRGVLRKIEFLQKQLEEKFVVIRPGVDQDVETKDRFDRMFNHYNDYKEAFEEAVRKKAALKEIGKHKLEPLIKKNHSTLEGIIKNLEQKENYKDAYLASRLERDLLRADMNIRAFERSPDATLIKSTNKLIGEIRESAIQIQNKADDKKVHESISKFIEFLNQYESVFVEIVTVNRVYLHLVNVVLAGKAAEIDTLSRELGNLVTKRSQDLSGNINQDIKDSQRRYSSVLLVASVISILSALFVAMGIAKPVNAMASTLSQLANGKAETEIPGQNRKDEVGQMAKAANEFKMMSVRLEQQSHELVNANLELEEFAYRTSHDLRAPLVSSITLLGMAKEFIRSNENDHALEDLEHVQQSLKKLDALVIDIHALTETKNAEESTQLIDVENLIDEALDKFKNMENFERLDIQKQFNFKGDLEVKKSRFTLVLENLISNAIKYQDTEKENSLVKISTRKNNGNFVLEVRDNGLGIPANQQGKLFTMFKRFHPKVSFGSGLGLYMMKKSVDILNGEIGFEDAGDGSIFKLEIPLPD